jgi:NifB/MoaA-like Fe-S oxidoreductase
VCRAAGDIVEKLAELTGAGIEVHTQVVLCPEWNDGEHLDRTLEDLWALGPNVLSISVVPVGLTRYNLDRPVRLLRPEEAAAAIEQVDARGRRPFVSGASAGPTRAMRCSWPPAGRSRTTTITTTGR